MWGKEIEEGLCGLEEEEEEEEEKKSDILTRRTLSQTLSHFIANQ